MRGLIRSKKDHEIAAKIKEKLEEDDNIIRMDKKDFQKEINKTVNKAIKIAMRKNLWGQRPRLPPHT